MIDHNFVAAAIGGFVVGLLVGLVIANAACTDETRSRIAVRTVEWARPVLAHRPVPRPVPGPLSTPADPGPVDCTDALGG